MLFEGRGEMAVARESDILREARKVFPLREQVQRARETQPQVVPIERHPFRLLEDLREVHRRTFHLGRDLAQRPASRQISREQYLDPVYQAAARVTCTRHARRSWPKRTRSERE